MEEVVEAMNGLKNYIRRELTTSLGGVYPVEGVFPTDEDVEDIIQEGLLTAWQKMDEFDPQKSSLSTWCGWILRGECANFKRRQLCETVSEDFEEYPGEDTPEGEIQRDELTASLTGYDKAALYLYSEGFGPHTIAAVLETSYNAAATRLNRLKWKIANT